MRHPPHSYDVPCPICGQMSPLTEDLAELTVREFQVLELIVKGLSNKEIAKALDIRLGTVRCQVTAMYRRFRVKNRTEAAAKGSIMLKEMRDKQAAQQSETGADHYKGE